LYFNNNSNNNNIANLIIIIITTILLIIIMIRIIMMMMMMMMMMMIKYIHVYVITDVIIKCTIIHIYVQPNHVITYINTVLLFVIITVTCN